MLLPRNSQYMAGVVVSLLASAGAEASTVTLFVDPIGGASTENTGASATLTLDFANLGADDRLTITIENTTPPEIGSKLTAVGLELPASLSLAPVFAGPNPDGYFDTLTFDHSVSPSWLDAPGGYDLMITGDGNFLGGNPNGAPVAGESATITLNLGHTGWSASELASTFRGFFAGEEDNFTIARFQAVGPDGEGSDKVTGVIPEPATLVLLGLGALAVRRRL